MRFWLTVAAFAVFNLAAWAVHHVVGSRSLDLVQVEEFSPGAGQVLATWQVTTPPFGSTPGGFGSASGFGPNPFPSAAPAPTTAQDNPFVSPTASTVSANPVAALRTASAPLRVRFNVTMDTSDDLKRIPPGRFSPPLAGTWKWDGNRELVFSSENPPIATQFTLTLNQEALRTRDGFRLGKPYSATFRTTPFEVRQAGVLFSDGDGVYHLYLDCSDTVLPGDAQAAIRVVEQDGTPVPVRSWTVDGTRVVLITDALHGRDGRARERGGPIAARLVVKAGLTGRSGPLGLAGERSFPLVLDRALRLERVHADMDDDEGVLRLEFNRGISTAALRQVLRVEPATTFALSGGDSDGSATSVVLRGAFAPGQRYAVVLDDPPAGAKGVFPLAERMPTWMPDHAPRAWFPAGSGRLGAQGTRTLAFKAVNLRGATLRIWRLHDNNLLSWAARQDMRSPWQVSALGQPLVDRRLTFGERKNHIHDLRLDLERELPPATRRDGVLLVQIDDQDHDSLIDPGQSRWRYRYYDRSAQAVVSLSDLALTCHRGVDGCTVWATSLATTAPLGDVRVRLISAKQQELGSAVTGADGLARVSEVPLGTGDQASVLIAESATGGIAWLALNPGDALRDPFADTGGALRSAGLSAFIHAERGVWRPGETAHLRAIVRDRSDLAPAAVPLRWRIRRPDWKVWRDVVATTLASGDLLLDLPLPSDAPTGQWQAELTLPGDDQVLGQVGLQVEDFMPDRLTIAFTHSGPGLLPEQPGQARTLLAEQGDLTLRAQADYLFGKPASGRTLKAWARLDPTTWHPDGETWRGWTFSDAAESGSLIDRTTISGTRIDLASTVADAQGSGSWDVAIGTRCAELSHGRAMPWRLLTGGEVLEVGGRGVSGNAPAVIIHPVGTWLGARLVQEGPATALELRTASASGATVPATAKIHLRREEWNTVLERTNGITRYRSLRELSLLNRDPETITVGADGARWTVPADLSPGTYVVCIESQETRQLLSLYHRPGAPDGWVENISRERPDRCEVSVRPVPPLLTLPPVDPLAPLAAPIMPAPAPAPIDPDARLTIGGDALITIRSPFAGRALLTVCTDRVIASQVLEMTGNAQEVRLPVTAEWRPDAFVCVSVIRTVEVSDQVRLHRAWGVVRARTDEAARKLAIEIQVAEQHQPGTTLPIAGVVRGTDGAPIAGATVTLAAVDEGILRLTGYRTPDPFAWFIRPRALGVSAWDMYDDLLPELPRPGGESLTGGDGDKAAYARAVVVTSRYQSPVTAKRVVPVAFWSGLLTSDAEGRISTQMLVPPGFNGRVRVMAVAANATTAGAAERWSTVRGAVVLQTSWPRFAAPGDRFRVSAAAMNLSGSAGTLTTTLTLPADGLLSATTLEITQPLADGAEAPLTFEVTAGQRSGVAQARISARLVVSDATGALTTHSVEDVVELPVRPASPRISVGGEAVVSAAAPWDGVLPQGFLPGSGSVEVRIGPRPALALKRGFDYLYRYPYGCAEQTTSGCFPLVHLREFGDQIAPDLFLPAGITRRLNDGIMRLQMMETDGGLGMWPGQRAPWSWTTIYATHFLVEAKRAGHGVPEDFLRRMLDACRRVDTYNSWAWAESQAYACYVLALAGQPAHALMQRLEEVLKWPTSEKEIGPSTRSWLAAAWMESGRKDLASALIPQQLPSWRTDRRLDGDLASPIRDRAVLLTTLIDVAPDHPAIPGLAQDLAKQAPWPSTQDTSFALIALGRYLRQAQRTPPPETVSLSIDGKEVGTAAAGPSLRWTGTDATGAQARITGGADARAWVSWMVTGVPLLPPIEAINGLHVSRRWTDEQEKDLAGRSLTSGDLVRVELVVSATTPYRGVVLEDLLPAGVEIENARLATSAAGRPSSQTQNWRSEVRDDRLVVMGDLSRTEDGRYELRTSYLARAVTPGTYVLPPLRAECMYDIAINGIAGAGMMTVLPAK